MADNNAASHLSQNGKKGVDQDAVPVRQHHRLATGHDVTGQTNPNGAASGPTESTIANGNKGW